MTWRQVLWVLAVFGALLLVQRCAHAVGLMGGVGTLMSPNGGGGGTPGGGFALLTEAGDPLATEGSSIIVTENAP